MTKLDVRPQRARRRLGGARVLASKLRVEPCPTFRRRGLCDECQPRCGATPFEPRPVGTVPECVERELFCLNSTPSTQVIRLYNLSLGCTYAVCTQRLSATHQIALSCTTLETEGSERHTAAHPVEPSSERHSSSLRFPIQRIGRTLLPFCEGKAQEQMQ